MKKYLVLGIVFSFFTGLSSTNAQDLIILKDGNTIEAKVLEISPTEIRYKRFDHLDGPTIIIMAIDVLSIRYENGRTEIINNNTQSVITNTQPKAMPVHNAKFNTLGFSLGYLGVSNFGLSLNGTVSPSRYTFFDFGVGLGFATFSFNGNFNFGGFVPFYKGGWYIGAGLGGGVYEIVDTTNGYFTVNAITGFLFFNWLNVSATLKMDVLPEFNIRINPMVGYVYRFKPRNNSSGTINNNETNNIPSKYTITNSYTVKSVIGNVQGSFLDSWFDIKAGDVLSKNTFIKTGSNSSVILEDGNNVIINISSNCNASIGYIIENRK